MCLYFALLYKTLGGYNWSDLFTAVTNNVTETVNTASLKNQIIEPLETTPLDYFGPDDEQFESIDKGILASAKELQLSFHGLKAVSNKTFFNFRTFFLEKINYSSIFP